MVFWGFREYYLASGIESKGDMGTTVTRLDKRYPGRYKYI